MPIDKELLFKARLPEADVDIAGLGTVRVRGLSRSEALSVQNVPEGPYRVERIERKMLALAMVDPELSEGEIARWQKSAPAGELEPVGNKVQELSGMVEGAAKEAYREFEADPDAEFRVLPGSEAPHDGGPDAGGDAER